MIILGMMLAFALGFGVGGIWTCTTILKWIDNDS